jgi:hypothetical protein
MSEPYSLPTEPEGMAASLIEVTPPWQPGEDPCREVPR